MEQEQGARLSLWRLLSLVQAHMARCNDTSGRFYSLPASNTAAETITKDFVNLGQITLITGHTMSSVLLGKEGGDWRGRVY